ncbi:MAG: PRD domain-containing protein, partial [Lawsonibacter sp.]|nr:PRD domain-containing protein [Lawsonibacter sp.]
YIRRLMDRHSAADGEALESPLSEEAVRTAQKTGDLVICELGITLDERYRMILASHIDTLLTRIRLGKSIRISPVLGRIREDRPALFDVSQQMAEYLRTDCGIAVPAEEVGLFANLLQQIISECDPSHRSGLLVICQALGSAGTMARVANTLLNKEYVATLDAEDKLTDETLRHIIEARLDEMSGYSSILILTDYKRLMKLCSEMGKSYGTPLYVLDDINTSMVIEAALLMEEKHAPAQQVYRHLTTMKSNYRELSAHENTQLAADTGRRAIVAACFSGCGVAVRLKKIIESSFELSSEIEIITMDIPSVSSLHDSISALSTNTDILCIVGMDVGLETGVPFIPLDEFVLGNGIQRLSAILDGRHVRHRLLTLSAESGGELCENTFYSGKYLDGYLFYLSGDKMQPYLKRVCSALEDSRGELRQGKRIMLTIHLAAMVERILFDTPQLPAPAVRAAADLTAALAPLASVYHIVVSDEEYDMIEQILSLALIH